MYKIELNLGRNCLKYIVRTYGIKEIFIPYYICPVIIKSLREENCRIKFYHINNDLTPQINFTDDDFILYVNYFGINTKNCISLAQKYKNLIVDNSHAFYAPHVGLASFTSLRKFFPVQNGAYLYINKTLDEIIPEDTLVQTPVLFHSDYEKFVKNELELNEEKNIKKISPIVEKVMRTYVSENDLRCSLFHKYAKIFGVYNKLNTEIAAEDVPYCYPFSPNDSEIAKILAREFCILRLWGNIPFVFPEYDVYNTMLALPLDEKYCNKIVQYFTNKNTYYII